MKNLNISLLLDFYGAMLTSKQLDTLELYYNEDLSLAEIAQHTGITRQGVRDSIKRGEELLIRMEQNLGFYEKYHDIDEKVNAITNLVKNIKDINSRRFTSSDINGFCDDILNILSDFQDD